VIIGAAPFAHPNGFMRIFISYAHKDLETVERLASILRKGGHDIWYDQQLVGAKSWKAQLLTQIKASDCFLYALTPKSVAAEWCQWEFAQAVHAGKPIMTVLLENMILEGVLNDHQYVDFRDPTLVEAAIRLGTAVYEAEAIPPEKVELLPAPDSKPERPTEPDNDGETVAQRFFDDAYGAYRIKDYEDAHELVLLCLELEPKHQAALALLRRVEKRLSNPSPVPQPPTETQVKAEVTHPETPVQAPAKSARRSSPAKPGSLELMPAPFSWIEIPKKGYSIAKYPVTNAQFAKFLEAGGYRERKWWTDAGWKQREKSGWTEPRYWNDSKWNGADQPMVGVSWFEAVAFCLWLSDVTGEKIMLPTEDQWQYAAQGDDGRTYPWGNDWDCKRCNNSVKPCDSNVTTPVTQYEGKNKGDSFFGAVDMAGNVWEWCLTDYDNKTNDVNSSAENRVLRGGSWGYFNSVGFRCDYRSWLTPFYRNLSRGFRLARS